MTNTLTKQNSLSGELEKIEKQFSLIPDTQPNTQNPFKGIDSRVSPLNKMVTNSTRSVATGWKNHRSRVTDTSPTPDRIMRIRGTMTITLPNADFSASWAITGSRRKTHRPRLHPTDTQIWVKTEDQELRSKKRNRSRSNSRTRSASHNY